MTTQQQMAMAYTAQAEVVLALRASGEVDLADRLERCMTVRRQRHGGDGWPFACRSAACVWCRRPLMRFWFAGMCQWTAAAAMWSLAIIPLHPSAGLPDAVRRLRRAMHDLRDRRVRHSRRWREVSFAGMVGGDGTAMVLVSHEGVDRREVEDMLRRRWPSVVVKDLEQEEPAVVMSSTDATDLGRCRRGVEPLRIVIMPQQDRQTISPIIEPMPVVI